MTSSIPSSKQMRQLVAAGYGKLTVDKPDVATETFYFIGIDEQVRNL